MILTAISSPPYGPDGKLDVEADTRELVELYGGELSAPSERIEVLDADSLTLCQRGKTELRHRGVPLDHRDRVYFIQTMSSSILRERQLHNLYHVLNELDVPLLNRSFSATPELECNKLVMNAVVSSLGMDCIPTIELPHRMPIAELLELLRSLDFTFPLVLKPNRLGMGVGIMRCDSEADFVVKVGLVRQLSSDYLIQQYVSHVGDLRVFLSRDTIFGQDLRRPADHDFRANVSAGGSVMAVDLPKALAERCLRIAAHVDADFVALDWLQTGSEFVFNEMASTLAGFGGASQEMTRRIAAAVIAIARRKLSA